MIGVIVPTYGRADRLEAVVANIDHATEVEHRTYVACEADDTATINEAIRLSQEGRQVICVVNTRARNYAGAATAAYHASVEPFLFAGSDDLCFHPGWDHAALSVMGAAGRVEVVGTNDLLNPYVAQGFHATHYLVARTYLDRDGGVVDQGPGSFQPECYDHQFTDTEFIATAKMRARFMPCLDSIVEHMHFLAGKSEKDATYDRAYAELDRDEQTYLDRRDLWFSISR